MTIKTKLRNTTAPSSSIFAKLRLPTGKGQRPLTTDEQTLLLMMLAKKSEAPAFDIDRLIPEGSFLQSITQHFKNSDVSYALPLFQLIMVSASWLVQNGATLKVKGSEPILPTLWTIGLAESGSSKTLATSRVMKILGQDGVAPVRCFDAAASDAQWIEEMKLNNGGFWFQDEVGKMIHDITTATRMARLKQWMLKSYDYETISNRIKDGDVKCIVERPHFTFFGLTVLSTWSKDVDATSMGDGFCQRMNYFIAPQRTDTSMFDHFLVLTGDDVIEREERLRETWLALCAQPGAAGEYTLSDKALAYLVSWWKGLERAWGDFALPASFMRRIGYSVLRYLVVLQFLLGKSRHSVDLETAVLAAAFAEYHMESALHLVQAYEAGASKHMQRVAELCQEYRDAGEKVCPRKVSQRLSKAARAAVDTAAVREIVAILNKAQRIGLEPFPADLSPEEKVDLIHQDWETEKARLKKKEKWRNEWRLRNLRKAYRSAQPMSAADSVVAFPACGPQIVTRPNNDNDMVLIDADEVFGSFSSDDQHSASATLGVSRTHGL